MSIFDTLFGTAKNIIASGKQALADQQPLGIAKNTVAGIPSTVIDAVGAARKAVLPNKQEVFTQMQNEAKQSLVPTRAVATEIDKRLGANTPIFPSKNGSFDFNQYMSTPAIDPTGAIGSIEKVGANTATKVGGKVLSATEKYMADNIAKREAARGESTFNTKLKNLVNDAQTKMVDFTHPIETALQKGKKTDANFANMLSTNPSKNIHNQIDRVLRAPSIATSFINTNGLSDVIKSVPNLDHLDEYLVAKHAIDVNTRGINTGRDLQKDQNLVKELGPQYDAAAQVVSDYSKKLLNYITDSGLISPQVRDTLVQRYPNYVPLKRVFSEIEDSGQNGSKAVASLGQQSVVQHLVGSDRAIESPIRSLIERTNQAFAQGEKNKAAQTIASYKDVKGNPFGLVPLRTTENVTKRIDLFSEAKAFKPLQNKAERMLNTSSTELNRIKREVDKLNKLGLKTYLKSSVPDTLPTKVSGIKTKFTPAKSAVMYFNKHDIPTHGTVGTEAKTVLSDIPSTLNKSETKKYINQLVQDRNIDLEAIKRKIGNREPKVSALIDKVQKLRDEYLGIKEHRSNLFNEAHLNADAESRGKSTISFLDKGVKNVYEVNKDIATAAKSLDVQQLNILGKIMAFPVRIARAGITGINPSFIAANIARDQASAFIFADKGLQSSVAHPLNFLKSFWDAVGHGNIYDEWVQAGGGGTSFDMGRDQLSATVDRIRAGKSVPSRILYTVKHPSELLRTVEDVISRSEEFTRIQQYRGHRDAALKAGLSPQEAKAAGAQASRENSTNFARRGEWGTVLNNAFLYLNAGIQGSRLLVRSLRDKPVQTSAKIASTVLFPTAAITYWNLSDPERKKAYDDIQEYEKQNNLIIVPPHPTQDAQGRWNVIKMPLPAGVGQLSNLVRRPIEQTQGLDPVKFSEIAATLGNVASPIDVQKPLSSLTPQIIKPTLQAYSNKDFFTGNPIVYPSEAQLPNDQQIRKNTSGVAAKIADTVGASPIKVDKFISDTGGGVAKNALHYLDKIFTPNQVGGVSIPESVGNRFNSAAGNKTSQQETNAAYAALDQQDASNAVLKKKAETIVGEMSTLPKDEAVAKLKEIAQSDPLLFKKIMSTQKKAAVGLTKEQEAVVRLGVANGSRAKYIYDKYMKLKQSDPQAAKAYIVDLRTKKILTDEVFGQITKLSTGGTI